MPSPDILSGAIDAGRDATQRTQERVETLFRDLLQTNLEQVEQAQRMLEEFIERSRQTSERIIELIDAEVRGQVDALSLATRADLRRLEDRVAELEGSATPPARKAPAKKAPAKKTTAKKTTAKKSTAKKAAAEKAAATESAGTTTPGSDG